MDERKKALIKYISAAGGGVDTYAPLVDQIVFLEEQLDALKQLPFIRIHPNNPARQKTTPAARQYRELLSQYTAAIKVLGKITGDGGEEDSPLRAWMKANIPSGGGSNE